MCRVPFIIVFLQIFALNAFAQKSKANEYFEKANKYFIEREIDKAAEWYKKTIQEDSTFIEAYFKLGQQFEVKRDVGKTLENYDKVIQLDSLNIKYLQAYNYVGSRALEADDWYKAKSLLSFSLQHTNPKSIIYKQLTRQIAICDFRIEATKNPLHIQPHLLSKNLNSHRQEYFPVLTADNKKLMFTAMENNDDENIYESEFIDNEWNTPKNIAINTTLREGTCSISADGRIMVFTACSRPDGMGDCDLYISKKVGNTWSKPENIGSNINTRYWESHPSLSSDGKTLYYSSDRPDGLGKKDIWVCFSTDNGEWLSPRNVGNVINTPYDEISPFLHHNGKTLFFASDGHLGMGGYDLFSSEKEAGIFTSPKNLGYPINTNTHQAGMIISSDNRQAIYSSDDGNITRLYTFDLPQTLADSYKKSNYIKGKIIDNLTKKPLKASIEIVDLLNNQSIKVQSDSLTGEYMAVLPNGSKYALYIDKKGYFYQSLSFDFTEKENAEGKTIDIALDEIRKDVRGVLANLFFDSGKWELKNESFNELDKVSKLLAENPNLKVEISGHTDDIGKNDDNLLLSQKRAQSVVDYLIQHGVNNSHIKAVGYGETRPLSPNDSDQNRQINRRIEMLIL